MKSRFFLCALLISAFVFGQEKDSIDYDEPIELEPVEIIQRLPVTSEKISKTEIGKKNLGQDIPGLLSHSVSAVSTSDAGAGIGYSGLRIRGIGQEHINITINGVAVNDPESQSVFWVNMPDLASQSSSFTVQRGVGTTGSGTGAFGAIINIDSQNPSSKAYGEASASFGSFNTQKYSLRGGTGKILNDKLTMDFNASLIKSDGYIERASSDLYSFGTHINYRINSNTKLGYWGFFGKEKTYQAWNGISESQLKENRRFNSAGAIYNSDWTEIIGYYDNETDNYRQNHNHLTWEQKYGSGWKSNTTLYYVRGKGYYENYKQDSKLIKLKIDSDTEYSDVVRQKFLDNHSYGLNFNLENRRLGNVEFYSGVALNQFNNKHYGKIIWVKEFENPNTDFEFYRNKSEKTDFSVFSKILYKVNQWEFFGDVQFRAVNYEGIQVPGGENEYEDFKPFKDNFNFINPKTGVSHYFSPSDVLYFYYGMAHREPTRTDYLGNAEKPKAEKLHDFELGYKKSGRLGLSINAFYMHYIDQLVATGELSETGRYIRTNSGKSYRTGLELSADYEILPQKLKLFGNLTTSINRNLDYHEIDYDDIGEEILIDYGNTPISFSPDWIASVSLEYKPLPELSLAVSNKYVGKQYLTNTKNGKLDDYFLTDLIFAWNPKLKIFENLEFNLLINNLFDKEYISNGAWYGEAYYYPQAGINILGGIKVSL